jgi:hypothetical protein
LENQTHSFIVRIWRESDEESIIWRGLIEDVGQKDRLYFSDLESITSFIRHQIGNQTEKIEDKRPRLWNWTRHEIERFWNGILRRSRY